MMNFNRLPPIVCVINYMKRSSDTAPSLLFIIDAQETRAASGWGFDLHDIRLKLLNNLVPIHMCKIFLANVKGHPRSPVARLVPPRSGKHEA
jgi:hypothetical protein